MHQGLKSRTRLISFSRCCGTADTFPLYSSVSTRVYLREGGREGGRGGREGRKEDTPTLITLEVGSRGLPGMSGFQKLRDTLILSTHIIVRYRVHGNYAI